METLDNCPVCNHKQFSPFLNCVDHLVSIETYSIVSCDNCGLRFTNPRPTSQRIHQFYRSEKYVSHSNVTKGVVNFLYQKVRKHTIRKKIQFINSLSPEQRNILDIGCGTGEFLNACKQSGWNTKGFEPNDTARDYAIKHYKLAVINKQELLSLPENSFDIITMWHVLEHVHDLEQRMKEVYRLVKPNGTVIIAVPNCLSLDAELYKENWAGYDVPRHLYHFTPNTITQLVHNFGMNVVKMLPMKFDSYYVSMLSEKYKNGSNNYLKAIWNGWQSNNQARKDPAKWSSLIYLITK